MKDDLLKLALDQLDQKLAQKSMTITIVICGAYAIQLHGFSRSIYTQDIDTVTQISPQIVDIIREIGESLGLNPRWLNDQASTVPIPDGAFKRAKPIKLWTAINASLLDRADLIKMKASAFSIRREVTSKDWEDLRLLNPTRDEINLAIEFLHQTNCPPTNSPRKFQEEFKETIDDLKKLVK